MNNISWCRDWSSANLLSGEFLASRLFYKELLHLQN